MRVCDFLILVGMEILHLFILDLLGRYVWSFSVSCCVVVLVDD
jgi:hypothetical protein